MFGFTYSVENEGNRKDIGLLNDVSMSAVKPLSVT